MAGRLIVDPITRIEGHLRIEAELDASNTITRAYSSGTMVRGIEIILEGRDPREAWAFAQRVCGVCTTVHAVASIRSVEDALDIRIPTAANLIRNMMIAQQYAHDHVMHFYHLHALDWVDVSSALKADPAGTSEIQQTISSWQNSSPAYFAEVQRKLRTIVDGGRPSIFTNGYWGHPGYRLPPEMDLLVIAHYLEALDWQSQVTKIHTIFGGKSPHPNFVVGGVPFPIDLPGPSPGHGYRHRYGADGRTVLDAGLLSVISNSIDQITTFIDHVYLPDLLAIAPYYLEYSDLGEGLGNFLTWGEFPGNDINDTSSFLVPRALILDRDLANITEPDPRDMERMKEFVTRCWYGYAEGDEVGLHPWVGETALDYTGPHPPFERLEVEGKYSWLKAPRWNGIPVEVGPLARVLALYASGNDQTKELVDLFLKELQVPPTALFSTLGRTAARAIETKVFADQLRTFYERLVAAIAAGDSGTFNGERWDPRSWPDRARGFGFTEAPRGALGHWIVIEGGKIANYQMVAPTTWNASPRDQEGRPSAYETSLVGTRLAVPGQPLEILRTIHSFDPCMACAVHTVDARGGDLGWAATGMHVHLE